MKETKQTIKPLSSQEVDVPEAKWYEFLISQSEKREAGVLESKLKDELRLKLIGKPILISSSLIFIGLLWGWWTEELDDGALVLAALVWIALTIGFLSYAIIYYNRAYRRYQGITSKELNVGSSEPDASLNSVDVSESTLAIGNYDTLTLDLSADKVKGDEFKFRLERKDGTVEPTEPVKLKSKEASFLFFLALNRQDQSKGECLSVQPEEQSKWLIRIRNKFESELPAHFITELSGTVSKTNKSWVYGTKNTRSSYVVDIHKALKKYAHIEKPEGKQSGPLLYTCLQGTTDGGYQLSSNIIHIKDLRPQN